MKRIIATSLLCFMLIVVTASADDTNIISKLDETSSKNVTATYIPGETDETAAYSVDIIWGNMCATYEDGQSKIWNPNSLEYESRDGASSAGWTWGEDGTDGLKGNEIRVVNLSNTSIHYVLKFTLDQAYEEQMKNVKGYFSRLLDSDVDSGEEVALSKNVTNCEGGWNIPTGVSSTPENQTRRNWFDLNGKPIDTIESGSKIGQITVSILP